MGVTQGDEGPLQVSFHLLPDALLDVVWTVAHVPLKHCQKQASIFNSAQLYRYRTAAFNRQTPGPGPSGRSGGNEIGDLSEGGGRSSQT